MLISQMKEVQIELQGLYLDLYIGGQGEPVMVLHGLNGSDAGSQYMERLCQDFHVIAPTHPGFGKSNLPRNFDSIEDLAYLYLELLDELKLQKVHLVGISLGGWVAAEMAIRNNDRLHSLTLIDAIGIKVSGPTTGDIKDILVLPVDDAMRTFYYDQDIAKQEIKPAIEMSDEQLSVLISNFHSITQLAWSPFLYNPKLKSWLSRIKVPTLVLWGEGDRVVNQEYGKEFAKLIPNAKFEIIPNAGHIPHLEQPDIMFYQIINFLEEMKEV